MIRCLAIDDESLALDLLEDNIKRIPSLTLIKRCKSAMDATLILQQEQVDLIFLDIQMPGVTGLQFLQSLRTQPMIIFLTAYKQYALEGFNHDVLDYLVKPVPFERFLKAVNKAIEHHKRLNQPVAALIENPDYLFVNANYSMLKITISDISYIEGLKDYVKIYLVSDPRPVVTRMSMKTLEDRLPPPHYVRIHKSYIVSIGKIKAIRKNRVLIGSAELPLSDFYRADLFRIVGDSIN